MSELELKRQIALLPVPASASARALDIQMIGVRSDCQQIDRVSCRLGDGACAQAHAAAIDRGGISAQRDALLRIQRTFGNRYVGEVLNRARADEDVDGLDAVERSLDQARGGGQALDHRTRGQMESAFGADFSGVRVHTDARADDLNQALSARAFATGQDVFFRQGEYEPGSTRGRELLAHELTHVVQQNGDAIRPKLAVSQPDDEHEVEADSMARAVMQREQQAMPSQDDEKKNDEVGRSLDSGSIRRQPEALKPEEDDRAVAST